MRRVRRASAIVLGILMATAQPAAAVTLRFSDGTAVAGLPVAARTSWGSAVADINGDGWPDVLLNRHTQPAALFIGGPGGFTEQTLPWSDEMDRHNCAWGEANGDARPDLFCAQGTLSSSGEGPNELWLNLADGFVESADAYGVSRSLERARTATWIDYDRDGDLDLFLGSAPLAGHPDVMMRNDRGIFTQATTGIEAERDTESATWADWDGNGYPDLLLTSGVGPAIAFTNSGGTFAQTTIAALGSRKWLGTAWGDFNGDGRPDLAVADPRQVRILRNNGGTFTTVKTVALGLGRHPLWVDLNNDGRLDLFVVRAARGQQPGDSAGDLGDVLLMATKSGGFSLIKPAELTGWDGNGDGASVLDYNGDLRMDVLASNGRVRWPGPPVLLQNVFATQNAAAIRLRGPTWNPLGMGATVRLTTPAFSYERELNDGVTWNGQSDASFVHLGLRSQSSGAARVTWPDGTVDCVAVAAATVTELQIGTSPCP